MPTSLRKFFSHVRKIFFPGAGVNFPSLNACRGVEATYDKNFTFCVFSLLHSPHGRCNEAPVQHFENQFCKNNGKTGQSYSKVPLVALRNACECHCGKPIRLKKSSHCLAVSQIVTIFADGCAKCARPQRIINN